MVYFTLSPPQLLSRPGWLHLTNEVRLVLSSECSKLAQNMSLQGEILRVGNARIGSPVGDGALVWFIYEPGPDLYLAAMLTIPEPIEMLGVPRFSFHGGCRVCHDCAVLDVRRDAFCFADLKTTALYTFRLNGPFYGICASCWIVSNVFGPVQLAYETSGFAPDRIMETAAPLKQRRYSWCVNSWVTVLSANAKRADLFFIHWKTFFLMLNP